MILLRPYEKFNFDQDNKVVDACREISAILADGEWHDRYTLVGDVARRHELQPKTVDNLLYGMTKQGDVRRKLDRKRGRRISPHRGSVALAEKHLS